VKIGLNLIALKILQKFGGREEKGMDFPFPLNEKTFRT
jgi:hypothetical protein